MWAQFLDWESRNHVGDLAGIAAVVISLFGFFFTLRGVRRSKQAAEKAKEAAEAAKNSIELFETVVDVARVIEILEEIKTLHRLRQWVLVPSKYATMRRMLISLRATSAPLSEEDLTTIQSALVNLRTMEEKVDRALQTEGALDGARFNRVVSNDIDGLSATLAALKAAMVG